ncbi:tyrosine-type recombinase/integrase [Actinacidiphila sp. bgisy160]|uniref:tyrosine-type recombinase/integrase n=1 Tax=Actinacidiphila sp. bgisy160 TaxID=3413796 RepID=UPI003D759E10
MSEQEGEVIVAELLDDEEPAGLPAVRESLPAPRYEVDQHTIVGPGEDLPVAGEGPRYSEEDFRVSQATMDLHAEAKAENTRRMRTTAVREFEAWCAEHGRVARPCTTATYTEYGTHLMTRANRKDGTRSMKAASIRAYMSHIRMWQPPGKRPDRTMFNENLKGWTAKNPRANRKREAFPLTLPFVLAMIDVCDESTPIGIRDAAYLAFAYRFVARRTEPAELLIEDLVITDDQIVVKLAKDKTHQTEEQTLIQKNRADLQQVQRMRAWLAYLAEQGVTSGPLLRALTKKGKLAGRAHATKRGDKLTGAACDSIVKKRFEQAGLETDGRPVTAHGLRAGAATDLAEAGVRGKELNEAGRWTPGSNVAELAYVRPAKDKAKDVFDAVKVVGAAAAEPAGPVVQVQGRADRAARRRMRRR